MQKHISKNMADALMAWFGHHRRTMPWRGSDDPYHIWVSEMMLQQTQVATVENYYPKWIARFPDVFSLAAADLEDVLKIWEGLGYYTRARNFHKGAKYIAEHAKDRKSPFPDNYEEWLKVPGVGPYTAAAVSSIAFGYPAAVVDGNVKRVMARLFCLDEDIATQKYHKMLFEIMNRGFHGHHPGWVNQAWMELGSLQCTPRPDCSRCPLNGDCCAYKAGKTQRYPVKAEKKKIPVRCGAAFVVLHKNRMLMVRRHAEGFLGGLWEFPGYTLKSDRPDPLAFAEFIREHRLVNVRPLGRSVRHTYSHFHQRIDLFSAELEVPWESNAWAEARRIGLDELGSVPCSRLTIKIAGILDEKYPHGSPEREENN